MSNKIFIIFWLILIAVAFFIGYYVSPYIGPNNNSELLNLQNQIIQLQLENNKLKNDINELNSNFPEIKEGIIGIEVDYSSSVRVKTLKEVESVFNDYLNWAKENNKDVFGYPAKNWKFENATIHGMYNGKKYWKVVASRFEDNPEESASYNKWIPKEVFDISEEGEVVRLLGGI